MSSNVTHLSDDEDLHHWQNLVVEHTRYLRIVESQIAGHGRLDAPPDLLRKEQIARKEIHDITQRIRRRIKHSNSDGTLHSDEEVDEIISHFSEIHTLEMRLDSLIGTREEYKRTLRAFKSNKSLYLVTTITGLFYTLLSLSMLLLIIFGITETPSVSYKVITAAFLIAMSLITASLATTMAFHTQRESKKITENLKVLEDLEARVKNYSQIAKDMKAQLSIVFEQYKSK